jgi:hypothetical protein
MADSVAKNTANFRSTTISQNKVLSCAPTERTESEVSHRKIIYKADDIFISNFASKDTENLTESMMQ